MNARFLFLIISLTSALSAVNPFNAKRTKFTQNSRLAEKIEQEILKQNSSTNTNTNTTAAGNHAPVAAVSASATEIIIGTTVIFNASSSSDPDGDTLTYTWDFNGDGVYETNSSSVASCFFTNRGTITVSVRVSDGSLSATASLVLTVKGPVVCSISNLSATYSNMFSYPLAYGGNIYFRGKNTTGTYTIFKYATDAIRDVTVPASYINEFRHPCIHQGQILFYGVKTGLINWFFNLSNDTVTPLELSAGCHMGKANAHVPASMDCYAAFDGFSNATTTIFSYIFSNNQVYNPPPTIDGFYKSGFLFPVKHGDGLYFRGERINGTDGVFVIVSNSIRSLTNVGSTYQSGFSESIIWNGLLFFEALSTGNILKPFYIYSNNYRYVNHVNDNISSDYSNYFDNPIGLDDKIYFLGKSTTDVLTPFVIENKKVSRKITPASGGTYQYGFQHPVRFGNYIYFRGHNGSEYRVYCIKDDVIKDISSGTSDYNREFQYGITTEHGVYFQGDNSSGKTLIYFLKDATIYQVSTNANYKNHYGDPCLFGDEIIFEGWDINDVVRPFIVKFE